MRINVQLDLNRAQDVMGLHIQSMVEKYKLKKLTDFAFIKMHTLEDEFADMVFRYKNQVYAILMDVTHGNEHITLKPNKVKKFIAAAKRYNLVPCVFPITMNFEPIHSEHGYGVVFEEGEVPKNTAYFVTNPDTWNLFNIEKFNQVNPLELSSDTPIEMSDYELGNFSVFAASRVLEQAGFHVDVFSDMPDRYPQILFITGNGRKGWCSVVYSTKYDVDNVDEYKKIFNKNSKSHNPKKDADLYEFMNMHEGILFCAYIKNSLRTDKEHGFRYKYMPFPKIK